jgi:phosphate/sulfate permease
MVLLIAVLIAALVFEYINGFHDAANAIATVVSTKVLTPRQAIILAAVGNLIGAFTGTAVAATIGIGLVDPHIVTTLTVLDALLAAIIWGLRVRATRSSAVFAARRWQRRISTGRCSSGACSTPRVTCRVSGPRSSCR